MRCPHCGHDNPDGVKFWANAEPGSRVSAQAVARAILPPTSSAINVATPWPQGPTPAARFASPQSYTPPHLAEKILTSRTALAGERKQVTVLFANVSGLTSISEQLDPEEVHQLMNRAFELMLGEVHRYEGTINQFLGDGVMALFGAPIAMRTMPSGRCMRPWVCSASCTATGLNSNAPRASRSRAPGAEYRSRGGGQHRRQSAHGLHGRGGYDQPGGAHAEPAEPGQVVIAEDTHRVVSGYFVTRLLGAQAIKGKAEPINAYAVVRVRKLPTRLEVERERGLTPFVGRSPN